jgi:hypothetical protein
MHHTRCTAICRAVCRAGSHRLPLLLHGWEIVGAFGWDPAKLQEPADYRKSYEPVFVLRNSATRPAGGASREGTDADEIVAQPPRPEEL